TGTKLQPGNLPGRLPEGIRESAAGSRPPPADLIDPRLVNHKRDHLAVVAQVEFLYVPGDVFGECLDVPGVRFMVDQPSELAPFIGEVVERVVVLRPLRFAGKPPLGLGVTRARGDRLRLAGRDLDDVDVRLMD